LDRQPRPGDVRVFISHAYEDTQRARRLYEDLKKAGLDPWLETESLLPRQNWESAVQEALRKSRYFLPLFSSASVEKGGFVLKEFTYALKILDSIPEQDIFIIPVRLDDCEIPYERLKHIQPADMFPSWNDGLQKILEVTGSNTKELELESRFSTSSFQSNEWNELLTSIREERCIPFIGSEGHTPWIPRDLDIAREWAKEYEYPLEGNELSKISLYLAIIKDDENYPKMLLTEFIRRSDPPDITRIESRSSLYGVLANLNLPIYITTNYDHLLEEALRSTGKAPVSEFCRWTEQLHDYTKAAGISSVFDKGRMYNPTTSEPLVYHLYGDMEVPQSMVLTEKNYFDFLTSIYKEDEKLILPSVIRKALATSLLLFIGYKIEDISFRIMLGSLAPFMRLSSRYQNIVILPPSLMLPNNELERNVREYLVRYARTLFNLHVYWADNSSFSRDLYERWQNFMPT
jgi:hypothetical protein